MLIPIQVNGRTVGHINVAADADAGMIEKVARTSPMVSDARGKRRIKKVTSLQNRVVMVSVE